MSLFSKIGSTIKNTVSGVKNAVVNTAQKIGSVLNGNNYASANQALNFNNPVNNAVQATRSLPTNQSIAPNMSTPNGPAYANGQGQVVMLTNGQPNMSATINTAMSQAFKTGELRPSTYTSGQQSMVYGTPTNPDGTPVQWSAPVDSSGRTSDKNVGNAYRDIMGNMVIPKQNFSGFGGEGGSGFSLSSMPSLQGLGGALGAGGGSANNGMTSSAGGLTGSSTNLSEEERQRQARQQNNTTLNSPQGGIPSPFMQGMAAVNTPTSNRLETPAVPQSIDAGWLSKVQETINSVSTSGVQGQERAQVLNQLNTNLLAAKTKLDQQMSTEQALKMVEDTPEQTQLMEQSGDAFGVKQAIDAWKAEQTNLGQLQANRVELMKSVQAMNDAYKPIFKDIKTNPDLPKGLARRRLEDLSTTQKETMQGFLDQLTIVQQQISDQNEAVNRAFGIVNFNQDLQNQAETRMERQRDNARQNLNLMIQSGAIAGFTDADIASYAKGTGVSATALQKLKETALVPKLDQQTVRDDIGNTWSVVFDASGKEVSRNKLFSAAPKVASTKEAPKLAQWEVNNNEVATINKLMNMRASDGTPYTDQNGYFTVEGFKRIVANSSLPRSTIIEQFAGNISPYSAKNYGLTPAEIKKLGLK